MDFFSALELPERKLHILFNEANRQRTLNLITAAKAFGSSKLQEEIDNGLKVHGDYTEGFYDDELSRLFQELK